MMSIATSLDGRRARRAFRFVEPRLQIRLAVAILGTTAVFCLLGAVNSLAAYKSLVNAAFLMSPVDLSHDLAVQTRLYMSVSSALVTGYALTVIALSIVFVHRTIGPVVAIERHVRSLIAGDYSSRIGLRSDRSAFSSIATHLNELAARLENSARESTEAGLGR